MSSPRIASFGPFRLRMAERILESGGHSLKIGSRALDILMALVDHAPKLVSKRELIARVWGQSVVEEGAVRFSVAALRKVLSGGDESSTTYVATVRGRGFVLACPVTWAASEAPAGTRSRTASGHLPGKPLLMIGREDAVGEIVHSLKANRFVSIVGAGGIGKTTVALAVAHELAAEFEGHVHFVDLAAIEDSRLVAPTLASRLGVTVVSDEAIPPILAFLRDQHVFLVLDSCEHVVDAAAALAESIFRDAPRVHILATSREALRAEGEQVNHLPSLKSPPEGAGSLTAGDALGFSAVRLFVELVVNSGYPFALNDDDASVIAQICRRLDGIALALELAACRVGVYGIQGTASLLDKQFRLWRGRRTSLPRHQTLSATLDWSYRLLSATEQLILRRLAVFVGGFSLEAALAVVVEGLDPAEVTETLAALVEKSLVTLDDRTAMRYRLLDTTRDYAWRKLAESGESRAVARRHGEHMIRACEGLGTTLWMAPQPENALFFASNIYNLRAALDWCFSDQGDTDFGVRLTAASASLFFQMNLLPECADWSGRASQFLDATYKGTRREAELQACLALAVMDTKGNRASARGALFRALEVAEGLHDAPIQLMILFHGLFRWQVRSGDFRGFEQLTRRADAVAKDIDDPFGAATAHAAAAISAFFVGDKRKVPELSRTALAEPLHSSKFNAAFGHWNACGVNIVFPRTLALLGYPAQAAITANETVQEAVALDRPVTLCYVLMSVIILYLENGDLTSAQAALERLLSCAAGHGLLTYSRAAVGCQGWIDVLRGELLRGIDLLQKALVSLHEDGYELYRPDLSRVLGEALLESGQWERACLVVDEAIAWCETRARTHETLDLQRVKAQILIERPPHEMREGEARLLSALDAAKQQGLPAVQLRVGIHLAKLWRSQGRARKAIDLLRPICGRFADGSETQDIRAAAHLLNDLRSDLSSWPS
jgi:predicted ATPase/DNA-binding winged helix-turn-helix (wHTH) protein